MIQPDLAPHQQKAMTQLNSGKVLCGGTGSGKTRVSLAYYVKEYSPADVYIITTAKKRDDLDWQAEGVKWGIGREPDATFHGIMKVDSWNNISKYENVKDAFFVFDEQRLVGNGAWVKSFLKITKQNSWLLLSATPGDTWLDYIPVFIANRFYKNRTDFKQQHVIYSAYSKYPKVDRYVNVGKLVRLRNSILVDMPYQKLTKRHHHIIKVDYDKKLMDIVLVKRWNPYKNKPLRNIAEVYQTARRVSNSDESRLKAILALIDEYSRLIIFYNFDFELDDLRCLTGTLWQDQAIPIAEWNGHKHESIPDTDRWIYLVQYVAGSEGWNCVSTNCVVFYSLTYSYKNFAQAQGRIDRLNTKFVDLHYYILMSDSLIDKAIWSCLKAKKSFNENKDKSGIQKIKGSFKDKVV